MSKQQADGPTWAEFRKIAAQFGVQFMNADGESNLGDKIQVFMMRRELRGGKMKYAAFSGSPDDILAARVLESICVNLRLNRKQLAKKGLKLPSSH